MGYVGWRWPDGVEAWNNNKSNLVSLHIPIFRMFSNNIFDQLSVCLATIIFASLFYYSTFLATIHGIKEWISLKVWLTLCLTCTMIAHHQSFIETYQTKYFVGLSIWGSCIRLWHRAKLLKQDSSNWTSLTSTYGYVAPGNTLHFLINVEHWAY